MSTNQMLDTSLSLEDFDSQFAQMDAQLEPVFEPTFEPFFEPDFGGQLDVHYDAGMHADFENSSFSQKSTHQNKKNISIQQNVHSSAHEINIKRAPFGAPSSMPAETSSSAKTPKSLSTSKTMSESVSISFHTQFEEEFGKQRDSQTESMSKNIPDEVSYGVQENNKKGAFADSYYEFSMPHASYQGRVENPEKQGVSTNLEQREGMFTREYGQPKDKDENSYELQEAFSQEKVGTAVDWHAFLRYCEKQSRESGVDNIDSAGSEPRTNSSVSLDTQEKNALNDLPQKIEALAESTYIDEEYMPYLRHSSAQLFSSQALEQVSGSQTSVVNAIKRECVIRMPSDVEYNQISAVRPLLEKKLRAFLGQEVTISYNTSVQKRRTLTQMMEEMQEHPQIILLQKELGASLLGCTDLRVKR